MLSVTAVSMMTNPGSAELEIWARVRARRKLAAGVIGVDLERVDGEPWPAWEAGAHIDLLLPNDVIRQYSLSGSPRDNSTLTIAVLREGAGRGGSIWIHDHLHVGAEIGIRGPRNHFELKPAAHLLFIAGGIGITPMLPMIERATDEGWDWELVYCGRQRSSMAYVEELATKGTRVRLYPRDEVDRADFDALVAAAPAGTLVYACGPVALLEAVEAATENAGLEPVISERFEPKVFDESKDTPFEVEIASDGRVLEVPVGCSILSVLKQNGINVIASCQEGTCGTCETGVISGIPDHRDAILTAAEHAENEYMMVCCSRSRGPRLVLDL